MDVNRGPLSGRVSGTYENLSMHFINLFLDWKFDNRIALPPESDTPGDGEVAPNGGVVMVIDRIDNWIHSIRFSGGQTKSAKPLMYLVSCFLTPSSTRLPSSSNFFMAPLTHISLPDHTCAPNTRKTGSQAYCEKAVPNAPGVAAHEPDWQISKHSAAILGRT